MSTIKIFALGGLGENGKNLYCVEVDDNILILDAGLKYPSVDLFGVDSVMPDMSYLIKNKSKVKGLVLSHGHEDHIGAVPELLKSLNISVFGTKFTMALLEDRMKVLKMDPSKFKLYRISIDKELSFNNFKVTFFRTSHSIPESVGTCIKTEDGNIVYTGDYTINNDGKNDYKTDFNKLYDIKKEGVLAFLGDSLGANSVYDPNNDKRIDYIFDKLMYKDKGRTIITTFSSDLIKIQKVIDKCIEYDKKIAIIGRNTQRIVNLGVKQNYLHIPQKNLINLKFINDDNDNCIKDLVVLVTGTRHEPFYMLQRMIRKVDKLIHINRDDSVFLLTPSIPGTEKINARTLDMLYKINVDTISLKKNQVVPSHADSQGIKLFLDLLKPKYVIPVIGEYRDQFAHQKIALSVGYHEEDVPILENGEVLTITDGMVSTKKDRIKVGDLLVDGLIVGDINDIVLKDRELLSKDGVFLVIANVCSKSRKVISGPEIVTKGFVHSLDENELHDSVREIFYDISDSVLKSNTDLDWLEYRQSLRETISKFISSQTKRKPIVLVMIVDIQNTNCTKI